MYIFILFLITQEIEGFKVKEIKFHGNRSFSGKELKKVIHTTPGNLYDEFQANMDKHRLVSFYHNRGFKEAKIADWKKKVDFNRKAILCDVYIEEGVRTYIKDVKFEGNKTFPTEKLARIIKVRKGAPLDEEQIFIAKCGVANFYASHGYPYAEIVHEIMDSGSYEVTVHFQINEHQLVRFGEIRVTGDETVRKEIIHREITCKNGNVYSPSELHKSQAQIYGTDLFDEVKFELKGIKERNDTVDVEFLVKERKAKWVSLGGGYSSPDRIWLDIGWGHSNLWNNGQKLEILGKCDFNPFEIEELKKLEVRAPYREPYFLNTQFKAELAPFYKLYRMDYLPAYKLSHIGVEGKIGRYIGRYIQSFLSYNYEKVVREGEIEEAGGIVNSAIFSISYDTRGDIFYPRTGGIQALSYEYAGLGGDYKFKKFILSLSLNIRFLQNVISTRIKLGGISGEAPWERRFALGGLNAIRGYPDMTYVSEEWKNWLMLANVELRIPVWKMIELAYFIDAGDVWETRENIRTDKLKVGAGFGVRVRTPIGPVRMDYGYRILETEPTKGKLYFGFGYMF